MAGVALVIGNANYATLPPLPACAASAHVVSAALKRAGFGVAERLDLTNGQMGAAVGDLVGAAAKAAGTSVVVYVCGYVLGFNGRAFLLPVSANLERDSDALTQGLVAKSVLDAVRRSGARAGLVLLDAVAKPGTAGPVSLDALAGARQADGIGLGIASTAEVPPNGATPFATALAAVLVPPEIEVDALLVSLRQHMPGAAGASGDQLIVSAPARPTWLEGGPAPSPPAPAPAAAAPAPVPAAPAVAPEPATQAVLPDEDRMTDADRRSVQTALSRLGYYDRNVDGVFGPDTRAAIRRFQHEVRADMTGRLTPEQAGKLLAGGR